MNRLYLYWGITLRLRRLQRDNVSATTALETYSDSSTPPSSYEAHLSSDSHLSKLIPYSGYQILSRPTG
jgi:hypothetical protein